jgi:LacI family transcriptional regulator
MKKITIKDVAEAAGVSYVTVSNVINGKGRMTDKTRDKVRACIQKMNFHLDDSARTLASGKSNTIVFISSYLTSPFVTGILEGVERQLFDTGNSELTLTHNSTKGSNATKQKLINDMIYGKKADAVIMLTIKPDDSQINEFKKAGIPLVLIESSYVLGANTIRLDNYKGGYVAVDYLLKKGKRKIAVICGPFGPSAEGEPESSSVTERYKGYKAALKDNGVEFDKSLTYNIKYYIQEEGVKLLDTMLGEHKDIDAIFCAAGDMVALGIIYRAKQLGKRIPQDISIVGYDDITIAGFLNPPLTTIRQPLDTMGRKAFDLAMDMLKGKTKGAHEILIMPELVIRESA